MRPLQYERQLDWPWSVGQTDREKLERFARRARMFRRIVWAMLVIAMLLAVLVWVLILRNARVR